MHLLLHYYTNRRLRTNILREAGAYVRDGGHCDNGWAARCSLHFVSGWPVDAKCRSSVDIFDCKRFERSNSTSMKMDS